MIQEAKSKIAIFTEKYEEIWPEIYFLDSHFSHPSSALLLVGQKSRFRCVPFSVGFFILLANAASKCYPTVYLLPPNR